MDDLRPNPIELAAGTVSRTAKYNYYGKLHQVSVRLQSENFLAVQAMAETAAMTRSDMINRVLEAGIYAIWEELDEEARDNLQAQIRRLWGEEYEKLTKGRDTE